MTQLKIPVLLNLKRYGTINFSEETVYDFLERKQIKEEVLSFKLSSSYLLIETLESISLYEKMSENDLLILRNILKTNVSSLEGYISTRALNLLKKIDPNSFTLGGFIKNNRLLKIYDLWKFKGTGKKTCTELVNFFEENELKMNMPVDLLFSNREDW